MVLTYFCYIIIDGLFERAYICHLLTLLTFLFTSAKSKSHFISHVFTRDILLENICENTLFHWGRAILAAFRESFSIFTKDHVLYWCYMVHFLQQVPVFYDLFILNYDDCIKFVELKIRGVWTQKYWQIIFTDGSEKIHKQRFDYVLETYLFSYITHSYTRLWLSV